MRIEWSVRLRPGDPPGARSNGTRIFGSTFGSAGTIVRPQRTYGLGAWGLTFGTVTLGWAFFAMDLRTALFFFRRLLMG